MAESALEGRGTRYCPVCEEKFVGLETCPEDGAVLIIEERVDPLLGTVIGQGYRIDTFIGAGGMGRVYRGLQLSLERPIAIKIMRLDRSADAKMVRRFLQEVRLSSRLDHPNIVRVIDGGNTSDGRCYLVMELLEGMTLDEYVPEGGLDHAQALMLFAQLCAGVDAFHRAGLVHRDLKPKNVILCEREGGLQVKIFDFGLAKPLDPEVTGLTAEGEFLGTPGYLAPEQMSSGEISHQTDVYALGAILYYLLSKRPAFAGASGPAIVMNQLSGAFAVEALPDTVSGSLRELIVRALAVDPSVRFSSIAALAAGVDGLAGAGVELAGSSGPGSNLGSGPAEQTGDPAPVAPAGLSRRALLLGGVFGVGSAAATGLWAARSRGVFSIAMSAALSGANKDIGNAMRLGLEARFALANAERELPRDLELEVLDDQYEPELARANVEAFVEGKLAVVGNTGTGATAASLPRLLEAKLPLLGAHSGAGHLRRVPPDRYVFNFRASYARETGALIDHFMRLRHEPRSIAVFAQDDGFGESGIDGVRRALAKQGFLDFDEVLITRYRANSMDVHAAAATLLAAKASLRGLILIAAPRAAAQLVAALGPMRPTLSIAGISPVGGSTFARELSALGQDPKGILQTQVVPDPHSSANGVLRYREALERHRPGARPGVVSLEGFIVGDLLVEALRRSGPRGGREGLVDALESFRALDLGFGVPISFSASDHQGSKQVWAARFGAQGQLEPFELN